MTAVTRDGERVEGVVKGEDAFSLQVLSVDGELQSFRKQELRQLIRSAASLMPVYDAVTLSDAALEDVLAYLGSLRVPEGSQ